MPSFSPVSPRRVDLGNWSYGSVGPITQGRELSRFTGVLLMDTGRRLGFNAACGRRIADSGYPQQTDTYEHNEETTDLNPRLGTFY
jgi:hypothetical protein